MTRTSHISIRGTSRDFIRKMTPVEAVLARFGANYSDQIVRAVDDVSLEIGRGRILGLVGESGCGKSTLGRVVAGLIPPSSGEVRVDDRRFDLAGLEVGRREQLKVQMVFQNPMASLNPRQRVIDIVTEAPLYHGLIKPSEKDARARALLEEVGLSVDALSRLPHQFSGGQRQRIGIARALSTEPEFLICDEPVAALDVSIQAQIINLLLELQARRSLTILFISHDLGVVRHLCDDVAVMYLGRIVETAPVSELFSDPRHPYTRALLAEMPDLSSGRRLYSAIKGEIPSPFDPPPGCHFHPRCPEAMDVCGLEAPIERKLGARRITCHLEVAQ